ncbi:MAG TPA: 30S ribosomal protein S20 [Myxococcota bacterium]|nr:30S ribosomal protein S20 [Myxococcota bacterium]
MANHKQALKRHRQSLKARSRNRHFRTVLKNVVRKATSAEGQDAVTALRTTESMIMHIASKGIIPKKRASRKVSRLSRRILSGAGA